MVVCGRIESAWHDRELQAEAQREEAGREKSGTLWNGLAG